MIEYPEWMGLSNYALYNFLGDSRTHEFIGEKTNRLSWDPLDNKGLIIHNVIKNDSGEYFCRGLGGTERHHVSVIGKYGSPGCTSKRNPQNAKLESKLFIF